MYSILYGLGLGLVDIIVLGITKLIAIKKINFKWIIISMCIYFITPYIFYRSLINNNLTTMNLMWDLSSDLLVTIVGLFYFGEILTLRQIMGVITAVSSMYLLR